MLISCGAFKKTVPTDWPKDDEIVVVNPSEDKDTTVEDVTSNSDDTDEVDDKEETYSAIYFKGERYKVPIHKKSFHIAVMLPFHSDRSNSTTDRKRSNLMLEYYQGMKVAIKELDDLESDFSLHFYDTDNDTNKLKALLRKPEMAKMDLILGPTDDEQVQKAAYFARKNKIPLFSPITPSNKQWSNNPYLFSLNPSPQMQAQEFLAYYKSKHRGKRILIVRDGKSFDKQFGAALVEECKKQKVNFSKIAYSKFLNWNQQIGEQSTVVVHTSTDKTSMSYSITGMLAKSELITLFASDRWMNFRNVDYGQWERLHIGFISTNKAQISNNSAKTMTQNYRAIYNDDPSWYAYMGYDQLMFSCEVLDAFGKYFPLFVEGKSIKYANTNFQITKTKFSFQNKNLQIFKLENRELILDN